ncbi:MAG: glycosyltransferase family 9 protein [Alphaproteobacteria bacterium]
MIRKPTGILFVTSTHIGDAILSTGLLQHLMAHYPGEPVRIACGAPAAKVFEAAPGLENLHVLRKKRYARHWLEFWRSAAGRRWRVIVDLRRTALPYVLRAGEKYTLPKSRAPIHRVELISSTLALPPLAPTIWTADRHEQAARDLLGSERNLLALAPGASWKGKIWPADRFVALAQRLTGPGGIAGGARILLVGAAQERAFAQPLVDAFGESRIVDGMGLDILSTYAALKRCRLFVGNDSAMMHLSAATGQPTVGLFGPTRDEHYAPWGENGLVVRTPETVEELIGGPDYDTRTTGTMMGNMQPAAVESAIRNRWGNELDYAAD